MQDNGPLIEIRDLDVEYYQDGVWNAVVEDLHLQVGAAETFGLVGESGCGKSTTANALLGYRPRAARYRRGSVWYGGQNLLALSNHELEKVRGGGISLVPQNPTTALSPGIRVGDQIVETLRAHGHTVDAAEARRRTVDLLSKVCISDPEHAARKYPHQLSGGQQQRVIIANALSCDPRLIVLDEPTTGLDVTTQAQILDLLVDLRTQYGLAMFYVTHNLGVVAQICQRIGVMYAGRMVEIAATRDLFRRPVHPYTQGLIASVPRISAPSRRQSLLLRGLLRRSELPAGCPFAPRCAFAAQRCMDEVQELVEIGQGQWVACWRWRDVPPLAERLAAAGQREAPEADEACLQAQVPLLSVRNMWAGYMVRSGALSLKRVPKVVVEDISLDIRPGETFALVGESGSGKTTVARALNGFLPYVTGKIDFETDCEMLLKPVSKRSSSVLRCVQMVFQNPDASLNPRQKISKIIGRPLQIFFGLSGAALRKRVEGLLSDVRLDVSYYDRFTDELSGGERQRIAVARALAAEPKLLLCDEVLSALDVSVQAQILDLLVDLQAKRNIAFLFIAHDLAVVRSVAHRVGVMYWGSMCEVGNVEEVFRPPYHPYTALLLSSVPEADPDQLMPAARTDIGLLVGEKRYACPFAPRCPSKVGPVCENELPPWVQVSSTHQMRCHASLDDLRKRDLLAERFGAK